jgi:hypothetical protein
MNDHCATHIVDDERVKAEDPWSLERAIERWNVVANADYSISMADYNNEPTSLAEHLVQLHHEFSDLGELQSLQGQDFEEGCFSAVAVNDHAMAVHCSTLVMAHLVRTIMDIANGKKPVKEVDLVLDHKTIRKALKKFENRNNA